MRCLFIMDQKDYDESWKRFTRPSVRGIIIINGYVAMVYSCKFDYYKFPGGGIENDETHPDTLKRELYEEIGAVVCEDSITEYGSALRYKKVCMFLRPFLNRKTFIIYATQTSLAVSSILMHMKLMKVSGWNSSLLNTLSKSTAHTATQVTMNT